MKAWSVEDFGHFEQVLQWCEMPEPRPDGASALIRVGAAGLTFALMLRIAGKYQVRDTLPFVFLAMFVFFLALQALKLVIHGSSDEDEQGDPPAG